MGILRRISMRMDRQAQLMGAMLERLEVDAGKAGLDGQGWRMENAIWSCISCADSDACERWLRDQADSKSAQGPQFCLNRTFFARHRNRPKASGCIIEN
ncbi:DUF6455 family protein [Oricola nitratireducens]|uniref:DUF6455 family protein n=1 Tax=Oricola nitratireducens TaxID=2775868 RepID=UPI0018666CA0|nr:DUF6455 family protein [Oricola nitratireducens]